MTDVPVTGDYETDRTFSDDCVDAARAFIQTILVVDDQARLLGLTEATESGAGALTPPPRRGRTVQHPDQPVEKPEGSLDLDVRKLMNASVEQGVMCSVFPIDHSDDKLVATVSNTARAADIVTLDWQMNNDDGKLCRDIIISILNNDNRDGSVQRLIAIYTGELGLARIAQDISNMINAEGMVGFTLDAPNLSITSRHTRICIFLKNHASSAPQELEGKRVDETRLPAALIEEYAKISCGLLTNVALAAVAAVRRYTPRLLAKYRPDLDFPYLAHRAAIDNPQEALGYAKDLIAAELGAAIFGDSPSDKFASDDAVLRRLRSTSLWERDPFQLRWSENGGADEVEYSAERDKFERFFLIGKSYAETFKNMATKTGGGKRKFKLFDILPALTPETMSASDLKLEFGFKSKIMSERDLSRYNIRLTNGVIVKGTDDNYLLCVQPACDSVRIPPEGRAFFFLKLAKPKGDKVDCALEVEEGVFERFVFNDKIYEMERIVFVPYDGQNWIQTAADNDGGSVFADRDGNEWRFRGLMKKEFVYRASQAIATSLSRIGVDEFELLR